MTIITDWQSILVKPSGEASVFLCITDPGLTYLHVDVEAGPWIDSRILGLHPTFSAGNSLLPGSFMVIFPHTIVRSKMH